MNIPTIWLAKFKKYKVWLHDATLFVSYYIHTLFSNTAHSFTKPSTISVSREVSFRLPGRDSKRGLPYNRHYYLSYAAPCLSYAPPSWATLQPSKIRGSLSELRRTQLSYSAPQLIYTAPFSQKRQCEKSNRTFLLYLPFDTNFIKTLNMLANNNLSRI